MNSYKKEMTQSHFNMWRLLVVAVHADHRLDSEELKMVEHYLNNLDFNKEQLSILKNELQTPFHSVDEILSKITDPQDRSQSVYFVRLLFWKDDELTSEEENFLKKVQDYFSQFLNMDEVQSELDRIQSSSEESSFSETLVFNLWQKISKLF